MDAGDSGPGCGPRGPGNRGAPTFLPRLELTRISLSRQRDSSPLSRCHHPPRSRNEFKLGPRARHGIHVVLPAAKLSQPFCGCQPCCSTLCGTCASRVSARRVYADSAAFLIPQRPWRIAAKHLAECSSRLRESGSPILA